jgi:hypothetical protein
MKRLLKNPFTNRFSISRSSFILSLVGAMSLTFSISSRTAPLWDLPGALLVGILLLGVIIATLLLSILFEKIISKKITSYFPGKVKWLGIGCFLTGLALMFVIPIYPQTFFSSGVIHFLAYLSDTFTLSLIVLVIFTLLVAQPARKVIMQPVSRWEWLWYALPLIITWSIYLLAFWPGIMSPDSLNQWEQMQTGVYSDAHPAFHTFTNWIITRLWLSPAAVALAQILTFSFVLGWGLSVLRRYGAPRWIPWVTIVLLILIPSPGFIVITLWKDVFYTIAVVALSIQVFEITMSQGEWIKTKAGWVFLGVVSALVALYRHNGMPVAFGMLFCLLLFYRTLWKHLAKALLLALLICVVIRSPIYRLLGVTANPSGIAAFSHLIARYTNSNTLILPEERAMLLNLRPDETWPYDCYMESNLVFDGRYNFEFAYYNVTPLAVLSAKLIYRNPGVFLDHMICNSAFVYRITQPPNSQYETVWYDISPNNLGLVTRSVMPELQRFLTQWSEQSLQSISWLIWRVPLWGYLFFAGILIYLIRSKNWRVILIMFPILLNELPLTFLTLGQIYRYVFPTHIVSILMSWSFLSMCFIPAVPPDKTD